MSVDRKPPFIIDFAREVTGLNLAKTINRIYPLHNRVRRVQRTIALIGAKQVFPEFTAAIERSLITNERQLPHSHLREDMDIRTGFFVDAAVPFLPDLVNPSWYLDATPINRLEVSLATKTVYNVLVSFLNVTARRHASRLGEQ